MKRQLPICIIEGTSFIVDIEQDQLRQADNPDNVILFRDIDFNGTHYSFEYDLTVKNLPFSFPVEPENIREVQLPPRVKLDPEGMAEKYNLPAASLKDKTDYDIIVDQLLLQERLKGKLPVVNIAGHEFSYDFKRNELRSHEPFSSTIKLNDLDYSIEEEKYRGFYNIQTRKIIDIDPAEIKEIPQGAVLIEIPSGHRLDPIATAREHRVDYRNMLLKYPIQEHLEAKVTPIEKTNIPFLVKRNRELERQDEKNKSSKSLKRKRRLRL